MTDFKPLQGSLSLGRQVDYAQEYSPALLCALSREESRERIGLSSETLPFEGVDLWTAYELSWLDPRGKPVVAYGLFSFPCQSPGMIESKSLKLYLNSLNQCRFESLQFVQKVIERDLSAAAQLPVTVVLHDAGAFADINCFMGSLKGECLDALSVEINDYTTNPALLDGAAKGPVSSEALYTHLLRTNCPVTHQPDWASLQIIYTGPKIDRVSLLKYICSFRLQPEFHEQCVERIFRDLLERCHCTSLTLEARFQRRGGLDINPFRSNTGAKPSGLRLLRQ